MTAPETVASPLAPYVPRTLVEASRRHGNAAAWHEWLDGALMHCDITGFTAMSESLAAIGNEGAELMASVLNGFFDTMLAVADEWGGVQMKFGGDAMLLYFEGADGAVRAAACGLEMQALMPRYRRVPVAGKTYLLRMRIGVHAGRFFSASAGPDHGHLQYVLLGHDVNETATIESRARPGQVVATEAAARAIGEHGRVVRQGDGVFRIQSVDAAASSMHGDATRAESELLPVTARYVLPPLSELLARHDAAFPAEQRRVTSMFVLLEGTTDLLARAGEAETFRQLDAYVTLLVDAVARHGGVVLGSDVADHGDKFIVLFGAPVLQEEHEASALRCAAELKSALASAGLDLRQRIGVNTGSVFAGEIGSRTRREYTVIGDTVNLAARLMAAAQPGQVFASASTAGRAGSAFELRRRKPIRVKGKSEPVRLFELLAVRDDVSSRHLLETTPFVGRVRELALLARTAARARRGEPAWCAVSGDTGIGKTRMITEAVSRLEDQGWRHAPVAARSHLSATPFGAWIDPLRRLLGLDEIASRDEASEAVRRWIIARATAHAAFSAVLCDLLGLPHRDADLLAALDARARRERLTALVIALLEASAREAPLALTFEDAQWSDEASLELLSAILAGVRAPLAVFVTTRDAALPDALPALPGDAHVRLHGLSPAESRDLVAPLVDDDDRVERIVRRGQGNPLFMIELAHAPADAAMPDTVNDVVLARLDALRRSDREVLRLASVIGPSFDLTSLCALDASASQVHVTDACDRLLQGGFLQQDDLGYVFAHALTREVAYETLLFADRRRLHRALAVHIEQQHPGDAASVSESLLHHYSAARDWGRVALYGVISGDRAANIFATTEAVADYQAALDALDESGVTVRVDRSLVLERVGDALDSAGRHRESGDAYFTALSEWLARGSARRPRYVDAHLRATAREALICRKISVSYERRSEYEQALSWIDEALRRLPNGAVGLAAEVMASKSVTLFRRGLYTEAIDWGKRAVALASRSRDPRITAYAHNMLANSYVEQGALKQAVRHLVPSTRLYGELHDLRGQSAAGNNLASCYQLLGDMDRALYHYQEALQADTRLGNVSHAAIIHNNIGEVLLALGRIQQAREHLNEVLAAYETRPGLAALTGLAHVNLSRCAIADGDAAAADMHARRGIRLLQGVGAQGLLDEAELQLVDVRITQRKYDVAAARARAAIERAHASGARLLEARGLRLLGIAVAGKGNAARALETLEQSASIAHDIDAGIEEGKALIEIARLQHAERSAPARQRALDRAHAIFERSGASRELEEIRRLRPGTA